MEEGQRDDVGTNSTLRVNPLKTKSSLFYLKTQSVPRCKHFHLGKDEAQTALFKDPVRTAL